MYNYMLPFFSCSGVDPLRVLTLNTHGASWFQDEPIISSKELYDVESMVRDTSLEAVKKPSHFVEVLKSIPNSALPALNNLARKKLKRFEAICAMLK